MERNRRIAKAHLKHTTIIVDGTKRRFDGIRIGLSKFHACGHDLPADDCLDYFGEGICLKVDKSGNLWMKKNTEQRIVCTGAELDRVSLHRAYFKKITDLRSLRGILLREIRDGASRKDLYTRALIYIQLRDSHLHHSTNSDDIFQRPIWMVIIHLVVLEMVNMLLENQSERNIQDYHNNSTSRILENQCADSPQSGLPAQTEALFSALPSTATSPQSNSPYQDPDSEHVPKSGMSLGQNNRKFELSTSRSRPRHTKEYTAIMHPLEMPIYSGYDKSVSSSDGECLNKTSRIKFSDAAERLDTTNEEIYENGNIKHPIYAIRQEQVCFFFRLFHQSVFVYRALDVDIQKKFMQLFPAS
ncbi:MH2 domain-containing protein [Ditylenchus destructor]|uniref:MH2 domain-containing protein n=1 Tax=Ditylenchus destructor TaxID=166010 RepID=A0AAD4N6E0_9BILA|nr:MH2 domain-containing protein [Ditylenchus destructor]